MSCLPLPQPAVAAGLEQRGQLRLWAGEDEHGLVLVPLAQLHLQEGQGLLQGLRGAEEGVQVTRGRQEAENLSQN